MVTRLLSFAAGRAGRQARYHTALPRRIDRPAPTERKSLASFLRTLRDSADGRWLQCASPGLPGQMSPTVSPTTRTSEAQRAPIESGMAGHLPSLGAAAATTAAVAAAVAAESGERLIAATKHQPRSRLECERALGKRARERERDASPRHRRCHSSCGWTSARCTAWVPCASERPRLKTRRDAGPGA